MTKVRAVTPNIDANAMLAGAQFADAFVSWSTMPRWMRGMPRS